MNFFILLASMIIISCNSLTPKLCINCKYYSNLDNADSIFGKCNFFSEKISDKNYFITGEKKESIIYKSYCSTARSFEHLCGEEGKYYKKKYIKRNKNNSNKKP